MKKHKQQLKAIMQWVKNREDIRTVILHGSMAQRSKMDPLSDIDLCLYSTDLEIYQKQADWFTVFAPVWLAITQHGKEHLVWKVVYEPGLIVEFGLYPLEALQEMQQTLPPFLEPGYKILLDKDKFAQTLPKPSGEQIAPKRPEEKNFHKTIREFWFNAFHVAKFLWRGELWRAKHYDWTLKQLLLQMMGWHAVVCRAKKDFTTYEGKHLQQWLDPETYTDEMGAFGRFYPADSWRALETTIKIFSRLAEEVAASLALDNLSDLKEKFTPMIDDMKFDRIEG